MSNLQKSLELKIERRVSERMEPMLSEMRQWIEDLKKINDNLSEIKELLEKPRKISVWRRIWLWLRRRGEVA